MNMYFFYFERTSMFNNVPWRVELSFLAVCLFSTSQGRSLR